MSNGFHNHLLRINLSTTEIKKERLPANVLANFLGGKGLGAYILTNEIAPGIDPLGPANKIIVATGPLQGSVVPICGRYCIITKSPLTGLFLDSHAGGFIGPELKFAGYDAIVVEGVATSPCFISILNDDIQIIDARKLKGLTTLEKENKFKEIIKEPKAKIMSIGPAGENLVRYACITSDSFRNVGRGGVGAVFGSKNLLGIAIKGGNYKNVPVFNHADLKKKALNLRERASKGKKTDHWIYRVGTPALFVLSSDRDQLPVRNFQYGTLEQAASSLGEEALKNYNTKKRPCYKCVIQCAHVFQDNFKFKGHNSHIVAVPEYETLGLIGSSCAVKYEAVIEANYLLNEYGLDSISTGSTIAFFMECSEKNLVPEEFHAERVVFGDDQGLLDLITKIAYRKGVGKILAEGTKRVSELFAQDTEKFAIHVKGLEMAAWDPRGRLALGLSYAIAAVGASHLRGWPVTMKLPKDELISPEVVQTLVSEQDLKLIKDSLIICHFTHSIIPALNLQDAQELYEAVMGEFDSIREIAQNIWSLTRYFNMREFKLHNNPAGVYDSLPYRILHEPLPTGSAAGSKAFISTEDFQQGLKYIYRERRCKDDGDLTDQELARIENLVGI
ncbi:MAG: aldehyde ferredoxin oxidoreductase family protein [Candidatus Hodarchaeales archaeon]|jgi:aldehyde:ferredoxin oxidoreductase